MISLNYYGEYAPINIDVDNTYTLNADIILKEDYNKSQQLREECAGLDADAINELIKKYNEQ